MENQLKDANGNSGGTSEEVKTGSSQPPGQIPPVGGGGPPEEPDEGDEDDETWLDWFYENNPLYLLSVLFMFGGLLMASQASHEGATLGTVVGFFGVQNIYEIIMIAMAIYLLRNQVNLRHGKILLVFGLVFLADVTFYQARITAMASVQKAMWVPLTISGIYLVLAGLKLYGVLLMLRISMRWEQFLYAIAAFGLVYFSPQYFMSRVYDLENLKMLQNESFPQWILFQIFLAAALIQIPAIVGSWRKSTLDEPIENEFVGDENNYYRLILLFPFFILPIQLHFNIVMDDRLRGISILQNYVPYLICGAFFLQSFIRKYIEENWNLNLYDFGFSLAVFVFAVISYDIGKGSTNNEFGLVIFKINFALTLLPNVASMLTRKNIHSAGFLAAIFVYFTIAEIAGQTKKVYENLKEISLTTWASVFMSCSFVLLILGFLASLAGGKKERSQE